MIAFDDMAIENMIALNIIHFFIHIMTLLFSSILKI